MSGKFKSGNQAESVLHCGVIISDELPTGEVSEGTAAKHSLKDSFIFSSKRFVTNTRNDSSMKTTSTKLLRVAHLSNIPPVGVIFLRSHFSLLMAGEVTKKSNRRGKSQRVHTSGRSSK